MKTLSTIIVPLMSVWFSFQISASFNGHLQRTKQIKQDSTSYKVYKIDSINNYYLIYARKGRSVYKIVSKKEMVRRCKDIAIDKSYEFKLHSILSINGHPIIPENEINELSGFGIDNYTVIKLEGDSIRDLYYGDNIKGLCFLKTKK